MTGIRHVAAKKYRTGNLKGRRTEIRRETAKADPKNEGKGQKTDR